MKLATTTGDFGRYTRHQPQAIEWIAESGFRYVDYNFHNDYSKRNGILGHDYRRYIDELKAVAEKCGVKIVQAHAPIGNPFMEAGNALADATILSVKACAELGIKDLVIHSAYAPGLSKEETIEKNKAFYMPILREAEQYDVCILTENLYKMTDSNVFWIDNARDLLELIEYVDHPLFHAVWDTGHANMQDNQYSDIMAIGKHLKAVHFNDNDGVNDLHTAPFMGTMNVDEIMHALIDVGYSGALTFESPSILGVPQKHRPFVKDNRLSVAPIEVYRASEKLLYEIGKAILTKYDLFEG